jgi:septin family protein
MSKKMELNILCAGELTSGRSTFLENYTKTKVEEEKYKIFVHEERRNEESLVVYFHEIE